LATDGVRLAEVGVDLVAAWHNADNRRISDSRPAIFSALLRQICAVEKWEQQSLRLSNDDE
jgi:hypothetical protein